MNDIPDEIRRMFPDQPIHKLDIDPDGNLQILASAEPLESDPHFEDMPIEQVNQYLREHGYDPEQVGIRGKILVDALIESTNLRDEIERLKEQARLAHNDLEEVAGYIEDALGEWLDVEPMYSKYPGLKKAHTILLKVQETLEPTEVAE